MSRNLNPHTVFKRDIAEHLHRCFPDHLKEDLSEVVDIVFQSITSALEDGRRAEFRGFGSFVVHDQKGRVFKNPKTQKITECPPSRRIVFKPGKELKKRFL